MVKALWLHIIQCMFSQTPMKSVRFQSHEWHGGSPSFSLIK
jgi:hypothetical protein